MRAEDVLYDIAEQGESQTVEFKASLSLQKEAIQAMVAFANSQGGWLFFGVTDDRRLKGVQIGANTLERLAAAIRDHTYPSLPVVIEAIPSRRDKRKHIVGVEVPADVPPVIGVYLYSSRPIAPDQAVNAVNLQAYRRVGRTNQKEDFMRLRQPRPSDPKLRVRVAWSRAGYYSDDESVSYFDCPVWAEEGSATAHAIRLYLNPGLFVSDEMVEDLPRPGGSGEGFEGVERLYIRSIPVKKLLEATEITSIYLDDWGIKWQVSRGIRVIVQEGKPRRSISVEDRGVFARRIVAFPRRRE